MAIFSTDYVKLGNIWPVDYLVTMPDGETTVFRLKKRENAKKLEDTTLFFVNADESDKGIYCGKRKLESYETTFSGKIYTTLNELCTIDYNGIPLFLDANNCRLGCADLDWYERRRIVMKLKEQDV